MLKLPLRWIAAAVLLANGFFPALWILLTSFKRDAELAQTPITWWPQHPTLGNYVHAFSDQPLLLFLGNSFAVALLSTLLTLFAATGAAYALTRLQLRRRGLILTALVAIAMFPPATLLVPLFEIMRGLGLINTYGALVLPYAVQSLPVCTLVLASFFQQVPKDIENAAMLDGCTRLQALYRIVLPLSAPGVFTAGILAFVNAWDEFLLALALNAAPGSRTLPVGILLYQGEFTFPWPVISAALVVAIVPLAILIILFQERVISGLTTGGIKG
ncbi:carbohydrate ABC transporter permease [Methylobacillus sp. Pita2]|uniref:carbohydrate ABC transporter permease n=1 Tax=Methylobacillus sp. Pita2 TaxID=3383245 RepID=UPI0038B51502